MNNVKVTKDEPCLFSQPLANITPINEHLLSTGGLTVNGRLERIVS